MSKEFTHLVLTRFNTATDFAPARMGLQTEWLASRLSLFEQYCLPSIAGQRGADFQWLVFFDAESPDWFRKKIEAFRPMITPMYIEGEASDAVIVDSIKAAGLVKTPYLLTTRVDNDDALAKGHLARVEHAFKEQQREFLEFPFGLQLFRGHLYNVYWPSNAFLSLVEKVESGDFYYCTLRTAPSCSGGGSCKWNRSPLSGCRFCIAQTSSMACAAGRAFKASPIRTSADSLARYGRPGFNDNPGQTFSQSYYARANRLAGKFTARLAR